MGSALYNLRSLLRASLMKSTNCLPFKNLIVLATFCTPLYILNPICDLPALPFLVVTSTTPLDALAPYIAAEDASFNISIDSISSGLISDMELIFCPCPTSSPVVLKEVDKEELLSLIIGIPSTTYKGFCAPRMLTSKPAPGVPDGEVTLMPESFPWILLARLVTG